ncbi:hypothetical protein [Ramlibacter albus]|uniref:Uncharacterized protein n=1 Tax=Ramlibacter albus TaxID=2079448 RepID=A0A923M6T3_9BURK|nr:hypothetical protein [Ramlibacter albus]MBC5763841.1 hypothetical protein [Ramlibacter albus]
MAALARTSWVGLLLTRLPRPLVRVLDEWSYRVAQQRAERRRAAVMKRQAAR